MIFKKRPKKKKVSRLEKAMSFPLGDKPFTKALLLRGSHYIDEAIIDVKKWGINLNTIEDNTLEQLCASCSKTIAHHITFKASKKIGINPVFLPNKPLPKEAPMIVAFSLFVLYGLHGELDLEGIKLDWRKLAEDTALVFFVINSDEEAAEYAFVGIEAFKAVASSKAENVEVWRDRLLQLVPLYILQWTTNDSKLKEFETFSLFGSLLSSLLKAVDGV